MSVTSLSPTRLASEALLLAGAVILAGFLLRVQGRAEAPVPAPPEEDPTFDDTGIPLRLAALRAARVA
jgi:hypothetical protein